MKKDDLGVHKYTTEKDYTLPSEPNLIERLEWFKDMKLGFMSHIGLYNHYGVVESWTLSDELDNKKYRWSQRQIDWTEDFEGYKQEYFNSYKAFNPTCFSPDRWAKEIKRLGFKYAIVTSKHHDGFCLWDTKTTDFKVTADECIFNTNPNANIIPKLYDAFRENGIGIATYFSKPDWSSNDYWCKDFAETYGTTRSKNYRTEDYPEKWNSYIDYAHQQIKELVLEHGPVDILWLDGGWVNSNLDEDFRLEKLVPELRQTNPDLLVCDRTNKGIYENYVTPEQETPNEVLTIPWEACITIGTKFGYEYDANYKSGEELIKLFVDILTRGGNLVINISPQPNGKLPDKAIYELNILSDWIENNKQAIYSTRPVEVNPTKNLFTRTKDNRSYFAFIERLTPIYSKYIYIDAIEYQSIHWMNGEELKVCEFGDLLKIEVPSHLVGTTIPKYTVIEVKRRINE